MSLENDIEFTITYDGKFQTQDGELTYVGGKTHLLLTAPEALFRGLMGAEIVDLYGQRIWYKLPFEDLKDLKILCDGSTNFENMCKAAAWIKSVEIYMEHQNAHNEEHEDGNTGGRRKRVNDAINAGNDADDAGAFNASRVEEIVAEFVDEEENNHRYQDTPPTSDCEDDQNNIPAERWRRGSGELKIMQVFESVAKFTEAVLEYALKRGWNFKYTRWGNEKSEAKCAVKGKVPCHWRIYCSFEKLLGMWMVKTFQEKHSCTPDGYCKLLTENVIADFVLNDVKKDTDLMPRAIQALIQERYNLVATHDISRKARKRALEIIYREFDEQYERIKDYRDHILKTNPESTVDLITVTRDDGIEVFDCFYVCFKALRNIWVQHSRPIFGIDGCFLKATTKGQLLAAVGRDANNQIYPIAWAVVKVENTDNWQWFIQKLKNDLDLKDGRGFTLISDKQKGLLKAVELELPEVEHRTCARHVYGNLKKLHPRKPQMKKLFWAISESFNVADYKAALLKLKAYDVQIHEDLLMKNPKTCSRAYFKTTPTCENALNNFSESFNSGLEKARSLRCWRPCEDKQWFEYI